MIDRIWRWFTRLTCEVNGHGPFHPTTRSVVHDGELRRTKRCGWCGAYVLTAEVDG